MQIQHIFIHSFYTAGIFTEAQLQQMRDNKLLTQKALNKVCNLLECQPGDILEYIPDEINQIQKKVES